MDFSIVDNIQVSSFDTACVEKKYLIRYNCRHFEVSEAVAEFIAIIRESSSPEEIADKLSRQRNVRYSVEDISSLYARCIEPIIGEKPVKKRKGAFLWDMTLIPASVVEIFMPVFKIFFHRWVAVVLLLAIVAGEISFLGGNLDLELGHVDIYVILGVLLLFLGSSLFHEFGHAAASHYYGAAQQGIGFGLYLNFPAFYTDVSDVWGLARKQRLVVNFAGVYFQLIYLLPMFGIYFLTHNPIVKYFIITININLAFTLNPFFKFDGYWIISDLLGVPNLRTRSKELFVYLGKRLLLRTGIEKPFLFSIRRTEKVAMIFYACIVNLFFGYYFFYIFPSFISLFLRNFPDMFGSLMQEIAQGNTPSFTLTINVVTQALTLGLMLFFLYRIAASFVRKLIGKYKKENG